MLGRLIICDGTRQRGRARQSQVSRGRCARSCPLSVAHARSSVDDFWRFAFAAFWPRMVTSAARADKSHTRLWLPQSTTRRVRREDPSRHATRTARWTAGAKLRAPDDAGLRVFGHVAGRACPRRGVLSISESKCAAAEKSRQGSAFRIDTTIPARGGHASCYSWNAVNDHRAKALRRARCRSRGSARNAGHVRRDKRAADVGRSGFPRIDGICRRSRLWAERGHVAHDIV